MEKAADIGIIYRPNAVANAEALFQHFLHNLRWTRQEGVPRQEVYYNDSGEPYSYGSGRGVRTYFPQPEWDPELLRIKLAAEAEFGVKFEGCFCNRYDVLREHLGWHADDGASIDPKRPILVYSFGEEREIWYRPIPLTDEQKAAGMTQEPNEQRQLLGNGSLFIMPPGMQQTHQHRIPKHDRDCGTRISLTFRGLI